MSYIAAENLKKMTEKMSAAEKKIGDKQFEPKEFGKELKVDEEWR